MGVQDLQERPRLEIADHKSGLSVVSNVALDSLNGGVIVALGAVNDNLDMTAVLNEVMSLPDEALASAARIRAAIRVSKEGRKRPDGGSIFRTANGMLQPSREDIDVERREVCVSLLKLQDRARYIAQSDFNSVINYEVFGEVFAFEELVKNIVAILPRNINQDSSIGRYIKILKEAVEAMRARVEYDSRLPERNMDSVRLQVCTVFIENGKEAIHTLLRQLMQAKTGDDRIAVCGALAVRVDAINDYVSEHSILMYEHLGFGMIRGIVKNLSKMKICMNELRSQKDPMIRKRALRDFIAEARVLEDVNLSSAYRELVQRGYFMASTEFAVGR
ncbi:MAG: hypothetical protein AAB592_05390 [Patescibacteria group bacterium]